MKTTAGLTMIVVVGVLLACLGSVTAAATLPPDPNNAALLYYQAFLLIPQKDDHAVTDLVAQVVNDGIAPNDKVREYVKKSRDALDYAITASKLSHCDWGLMYSRGFAALLPYLGQSRSLARLLLAEARILNAEGNYREALDRCLAVYRLAGQLGDDPLISFLVSAAITGQANKTVTAVLDRMPADAGTLTWLKGQLAVLPVNTPAIEKSLTIERDLALDYFRPQRREDLVQALILSNGFSEAGGMTAEEIRKLATEPTLTQAREYYAKFMDSVLAVLRRPLPGAEAYAKLQELVQQTERDVAKNPAVVKLFRAGVPATAKTYAAHVRHRADLNALQVALDVYLAKAATGRLPQTLPSTSLKDPYTGGAFQYEATGEGFVLRCGAKDLDQNEVREYHFRLAK